ncbi:hypothetical protein [Phreatobacter stygius]|uniref:hypothetical protein n=1 Tax=Phreatobacter stygius TaxID=1940610 RepID=UPI001476995E|nr:hypothetical protein [Phreatobacter stygius]
MSAAAPSGKAEDKTGKRHLVGADAQANQHRGGGVKGRIGQAAQPAIDRAGVHGR